MNSKNIYFCKGCLFVRLAFKNKRKSKQYSFSEWGDKSRALKAAISYRDQMKVVFRNAKRNKLNMIW